MRPCSRLHALLLRFCRTILDTESQREQFYAKAVNERCDHGPGVLGIELVSGRQSLMGYQGTRTSNFLKVFTTQP